MDQPSPAGAGDFRSLADTIREMLLVVARDGYLRYANLAARELLGYPHEMVATMRFPALFRPDDAVSLGAAFSRTLTGSRTDFDAPLVTKDGALVPASIRLREGVYEGEECVLAWCDQRIAEQEASQYFESLFSRAPTPMSLPSI
jgi:PAS domain S-box-containing protein